MMTLSSQAASLRKVFQILVAAILLFPNVTALRGGGEGTASGLRSLQDYNVVVCRILLLDSINEDAPSQLSASAAPEVIPFGFDSSISYPSSKIFPEYQVGCVPFNGEGQQEQQIYEIYLSKEYLEEHLKEISEAQLILSIQGAELSDANNSVILSPDTAFTVIPPTSQNVHDFPGGIPLEDRLLRNKARRTKTNNQQSGRRSQESVLPPEQTMGSKKLVGVRIITKDSAPTTTQEQMYFALFSQPISLTTQFFYCSVGQLSWTPAGPGVVDAFVPENTSFYKNSEEIVVAAMTYINEVTNTTMDQWMDKAIFCLPNNAEGSPGSSAIGWWRARMRDEYCDSLSGMIHETGHMLGLKHSGQDITQRYGDKSGYMGEIHQYPIWPRKCFNGFHHWQLGWYASRSTEIGIPEILPGWATLVNISAFVDILKTKDDQYCVVNVANQYFLQYNRAKSYNVDTEEERDCVTVVADLGYMSDLKAGLNTTNPIFVDANFSGSGLSLIIEVCEQRDGTATEPDTMTVSIGIETTLCSNPSEPEGAVFSPSLAPLISPQLAPSSEPTTLKVQTLPPVAIEIIEETMATPSASPLMNLQTAPRSDPTISMVQTLPPVAIEMIAELVITPTAAPAMNPQTAPSYEPAPSLVQTLSPVAVEIIEEKVRSRHNRFTKKEKVPDEPNRVDWLEKNDI